MAVKIIVAFDKLRVIGKDNMLPWRLREDMRLFKERTMGHAVIMGRKTWESLWNIGAGQNFRKRLAWLPGRTNYIVTRDESALVKQLYELDHCKEAIANGERVPVYPVSIERMLALIQRTGGKASEYTTPELPADYWVIGGETIYDAFLKADVVDRVIASEVDGEHAGDAFFPQLAPDEWHPSAMASYQGFKVVEYHRHRIHS